MRVSHEHISLHNRHRSRTISTNRKHVGKKTVDAGLLAGDHDPLLMDSYFSRYRDLLPICRLLRNMRRACLLAQPTCFPLQNRHTTDGRQVHASSVEYFPRFPGFVRVPPLCAPTTFFLAEGKLAKLDENRRAVGNAEPPGR